MDVRRRGEPVVNYNDIDPYWWSCLYMEIDGRSRPDGGTLRMSPVAYWRIDTRAMELFEIDPDTPIPVIVDRLTEENLIPGL